jgi:pyrimidine operon attenuation protein/uracil phosphoribosyltransferase
MRAERQIMDADGIRRALTRVAHEILEWNKGVKGLVLGGIHTRGVPLAGRLSGLIDEFEGAKVPLGTLDVSFYRDDSAYRSRPKVQPSSFPVDIDEARVVLVDDVLFTGRSVRAAMDALLDLGRPRQVQLAVLVDRGHRELPIRPDYVGYNIPTALDEQVRVRLMETDGLDEVALVQKGINQ